MIMDIEFISSDFIPGQSITDETQERSVQPAVYNQSRKLPLSVLSLKRMKHELQGLGNFLYQKWGCAG